MMDRLWTAAMWGGFVALDFTGWGPFMVAQPIVCGPFFGFLFDRIDIGLVIGGVVQLLWLDVTPVGVGIPFDATAVTLLAVYWATLHPNSGVTEMMLALFMAVPFGVLFRWMDVYARRLNSFFMRRVESVSDDRLPAAINMGIAASLSWSWIRYTACYALAIWAGTLAWPHVLAWQAFPGVETGLAIAAILIPMAGLGVALELFLADDKDGRLGGLRLGSNRRRNRE